jgi:hypothetical protein
MEDFLRKFFLVIPFFPIILTYRIFKIVLYYFFITLILATIIIYFLIPIKKKLDDLYLFIFYLAQFINDYRENNIHLLDDRAATDKNKFELRKELNQKKFVIYTNIKSTNQFLSLFLFLNKSYPLFFLKNTKSKLLRLVISFLRKKQTYFFLHKINTIRVVFCEKEPDEKSLAKKNNKKTIFAFFTQKSNNDSLFIIKK